ncbi:MAG: aminotransferase class III-fold pyridoxal phosphate-dependent enzyme, partial [Nitrososphaerales archaeon]|nr:aminotransferase class III-fold pyridoxal phosphate-dependent enzyme [Nitrososphaerales archaeon]
GYTNRKKILKFEGCYHGSHDSVLVKAGSGALTFGVPSSLGVLEDLAKHTLISRFNNIELTEKVVRENKDDLAAIIVEPVMANAGLIKPRRDFLLSLRELADYSDAILIFDEVVTGFRLALGGAQEYYEIEADLTTLGKVLGGGLPISAFGGREDIMKNLSPIGKVYQAGTYSGNPLSTTAALTVLDILEENPQIYCEMRMKVDRLCKEIKEFIEEMKLPLTVNHIESMFQIFFIQGAHESIFSYEDVQRSNLNWFKEYFLNMLNNGVFLPPSQFETCFLSASHTDEDIEKTIGAIKESLSALKR